jgi:hypothetical protein
VWSLFALSGAGPLWSGSAIHAPWRPDAIGIVGPPITIIDLLIPSESGPTLVVTSAVLVVGIDAVSYAATA